MKVKFELEKSIWDKFVQTHTDGNFFQTYEYYEINKITAHCQPFSIFILNDSNTVLGLINFAILKEHSGFIGNFSARAIVDGGPIILNHDTQVLDKILIEFKKVVNGKAIFSLFRNFWEWNKSEKEVFIRNGFLLYDHLNIFVNLSKSKSNLWQDVHSKRRNEIRRAGKEGTSFAIMTNPEDLIAGYKILKEVYYRAGLPLNTFSYFENVYKIAGPEHFKVFFAFFEGKIIGTMFTLCYKQVVYDWYAGSYKEYYKKYPNDLIPWEVFLWAKDYGYTLFDFGGAGNPNKEYGVRDYKLKFGGDLVNHGRFEMIHKPLLMRLGIFGLYIYKQLKKLKLKQ